MLSRSTRLSRSYQRFIDWYHTHPPEHAIRGATIGMFAAFTPTIGIQIPILIGIRLLLNRYWDFSLPVAIACTFVTNVFTFAPVYYLFVVTGRVMLGRWDQLAGFASFSARLSGATSTETGLIESVWVNLVNILDTFGLPLFIGCLPWAFSIALLTYLVASRISRRR